MLHRDPSAGRNQGFDQLSLIFVHLPDQLKKLGDLSNATRLAGAGDRRFRVRRLHVTGR